MKWIQPQTAAEVEWQQAKVEMRKLRVTFVRWYIPLAVLTAYIVYRVNPSEAPRVAWILASLMVILPAWFRLIVWTSTKAKIIYEITDRGLFSRSGKSFFYPWNHVEGYRFADHPGAPGLRTLEVKIRRFRKWRCLAFDPLEVKEPALHAIMEEHLPGKRRDATFGDVSSQT